MTSRAQNYVSKLTNSKSLDFIKEIFIYFCRDSSDSNIRNYYKLYCKILKNAIKEAKRGMYNNQIIN
jgi:hypothetical protein